MWRTIKTWCCLSEFRASPRSVPAHSFGSSNGTFHVLDTIFGWQYLVWWSISFHFSFFVPQCLRVVKIWQQWGICSLPPCRCSGFYGTDWAISNPCHPARQANARIGRKTIETSVVMVIEDNWVFPTQQDIVRFNCEWKWVGDYKKLIEFLLVSSILRSLPAFVDNL